MATVCSRGWSRPALLRERRAPERHALFWELTNAYATHGPLRVKRVLSVIEHVGTSWVKHVSPPYCHNTRMEMASALLDCREYSSSSLHTHGIMGWGSTPSIFLAGLEAHPWGSHACSIPRQQGCWVRSRTAVGVGGPGQGHLLRSALHPLSLGGVKGRL